MEAFNQFDHQFDHHHHNHSQLTADKLALIKLSTTELDGDALSDAGTVNVYRNGGFSRSGTLRSSRRQSSLLRSSRTESSSYAKFSSETTAQVETKFTALMDIISNASREASSLQSIWERLKHEREVYLEERESLIAQATELTAELTSREEERTRHSTEVIDRKKQVEKLLAELTTALATITAEKELVAERDAELKRVHAELRETRDSVSHHTSQYSRTRQELDVLSARLKQTELERDAANEASEKYQRELSRATRERGELSTQLTEVTSRFEIAQKDVHSLTARVKLIETERDEGLLIVDRLKGELQRTKQKSAEDAKEAIEATEKYEKAAREITRIKETVTLVEAERDDHVQTSESLRRQIKTHLLEHDKLAGQLGDVTQKYEAVRRELIATQESLRSLELRSSKDVETIERTRESLRGVTRERDELGDELNAVKRRLEEHRQQVILAQDNLRKGEDRISELQIEVTALNEKIRLAYRERDEAHDKSGHSLTEINQLRERIAALEKEKRGIIESRSSLAAELELLRSKYSEVTETVTSFRDDADDLEQEIDSLRALLRESREQRERAVNARESADKERDEYILRYEEKCRELERLKESSYSRSASYSQSHQRGSRLSRTVTTRSVSQSHLNQESGHESHHASSAAAEGTLLNETPEETHAET
ncbi:hypothetical protein A1O3_05544 [Capronia epimyces CBS 606.96]|uniref:Uncharacterized protein n=1 Tax=Capronia epimyces CBS 606.96 TaxID=1182542 RepID=W9YRI0_9EURO|nr:uncharacterized protein A1O3_05544 [Capronia epimyces CBS 606.96]EXJ84869.1 hypothetical protein A1O3_05544 [Capronia epimyces CBS 606.96]